MSIITQANLRTLTDKLANVWDRLKPYVGSLANVAAPVAGTGQYAAKGANDTVLGTADYDPILDMGAAAYAFWQGYNAEGITQARFRSMLDSINNHMSRKGPGVDSSITSLSAAMTYYNTTAFTSLLSPAFGDLWYAVYGVRLPAAGLFHPAIHPTYDSTVSANGMGLRAVGGSFTAGTAASYTLYEEVTPLLEVTVDFASGGAAPVISVAGTDHTGATSTTWDVTLGSNNPTAAVSTTTSEAITAQDRQTITLASGTGIVAGSVLTINAGLDDEEVIVVESVSGADIVAVFNKAHDSGAAVTGKTTVALTPSVAGRRLRSVSGITITISSHSAGTVRVVGKMDRGWA